MEIKSRLKDRLARIFRPPSLLRSSAAATASSRSLSASAAGASSRSLPIAADIAHEPVFVPRCRASEADELHLSLLLRSFSLDRRTRKPLVSSSCGGCHPTSLATSTAKKKERILRENCGFCEKTGDGRTCPPASPSLPSPKSAHDFYHCFKEEEMPATNKKKKKKKKKQHRCRSNRQEPSISASSFNDEAFGFFSSEETETYFSSRSFSSDSSEFYRCPLPRKNMTSKKKKKEEEKSNSSFRPTRTRRRAAGTTAAKVMGRDHRPNHCRKIKSHLRQTNFSEKENIPSEAEKILPKQKKKSEMNGFQPLVSVSLFEEEEDIAESRGEGFAVVKRSSDPYGDFRISMAEMIVERQIFGTGELERLLHCYLSLNSAENHSAILRAFADISEVLFSY